MKILCIASEIGYFAPGIVYEKLINGLSTDNEISVICPRIKNKLGEGSVHELKSLRYRPTHPRIDKALYAILGVNIYDYIWALFSFIRLRNKKIDENDIVISFVSFHNYISLILAKIIAPLYKIKWIVYLVDAVPAPIGWEEESISYERQKKFLKRLLGKSDAIISANPQMLDYQLGVIGKYNGYSSVLYVSHSCQKPMNFPSSTKGVTFLYAGSIYGPRRIDTMLNAYRRFVIDNPKAKLIFIGKYNELSFVACKDLIEAGNIEIMDFVNDLTPYYKKATVLIDVNAYFDNDIYLSSKIVNYLPVYKPIICVTGDNSPARNLFVHDGSILHCHHSEIEILDCLRKSVNTIVDKEERQKYVDLLLDSNIVSCFTNQIHAIIAK